MRKIKTKFLETLGRVDTKAKENAEIRKDARKNLIKFLEQPSVSIEDFIRSDVTVEEADMIKTLSERLNSPWLRDEGVSGLKNFLVNKLKGCWEKHTDGKMLFEALDYYNNILNSNIATINLDSKDTIYTDSKEFIKLDNDEILAKKRDILREAIVECGFEESITNNNLTTFFLRVSEFISALSLGFDRKWDEEIVAMKEKVLSDTLFNPSVDLELATKSFEVKDIFKEKDTDEDIVSTPYIIKNMDAEGENNNIALFKALTQCLYGYTIRYENIRKLLKEQADFINNVSKEVKSRYNDVYVSFSSNVIATTLNDDGDNPSDLNFKLNKYGMIIRLYDKYAITLSYKLFKMSTDLIMHVIHFEKVRALLYKIAHLSLEAKA